MPETTAFQTKPQIALEQIKAARAAGLPEGVVLMDAGYGNDTELRTAITALSMSYVAVVLTTTAWPPGTAPLLLRTRSGRDAPNRKIFDLKGNQGVPYLQATERLHITA